MNITVITTNYLLEGDEIKITLPKPFYFSETTQVIGKSSNLRPEQEYSVSVGLDAVQITLMFPLFRRRLQSGSTERIRAGSSITLASTDVKNSPSTGPTTGSISYQSFVEGELIE